MMNPATLHGVLWMGGAVLCFSAMAVAARELLRHMGTFEVLFWRTAVSFIILMAFVPRVGFASLRIKSMSMHIWRNIAHFGGQGCWVYAIGALPLATVFAIEFTFPVWTAVLAVMFLGERMNRHRIVMLVLGLAGVLIILRPGLGDFPPASLVMLLGSLLFAAQMIFGKRIVETDSPYAVLFWMSVLQTPVSIALAWPTWVTPAGGEWFWVVFIGFGSFFAHYCLVRSMKLADATVVVPVDFFRLPLIAVIGALAYGEPFDLAIMIGAAVIFAGTYYSISRERRV
jgi:drug/metabolite transporter (DMT)-like permease